MPATFDSPSTGRALVVTASDEREEHAHRPIRRVSGFITHLIATARNVPQVREVRRADPDDVIAAYRATVERIRRLNDKT